MIHDRLDLQPPMAMPFTILFAEDDTAVRDVVVRMLSDRGFRVFAASDGYEALRIVAEHHVDLLFTNIVMAGLDGVQLAKQAKVMRPGLKVLFATGHAQKAAEVEAMGLGKPLLKPIRPDEVMQEIDALLAG